MKKRKAANRADESAVSTQTLTDDVLGELRLSAQLDEKHCEYKTVVSVKEADVGLYLYSDPGNGETASVLRIGRAVVHDFEKHWNAVVRHLTEEFIPRWNENFSLDCATEDVLIEIAIENITVHANGKFSFGFGAFESLNDHCLVVHFSKEGHVEHGDTPG